MDALALLASLGLSEKAEIVQAERPQAVPAPLTRAQLRIGEAQADVLRESATLQATAKALATAKELGVDLVLPSDLRPLANAKRSLVSALKWADSKDYRPRAIIAAEKAGTSEGRKAKEEIRQQIRFLWKLYNRAESQGDSSKATSLEKELEALYRGRKLVASFAGKIRARSGRKCPYSAEGKSKRSYKLVIEQSCKPLALSASAKRLTKSGAVPLACPAYPEESAERLEALGEKPAAVKVQVKHSKLVPLWKRPDAPTLPDAKRQPVESASAKPDAPTETLEAIKAEQLANYIQRLKDGLELAPVFIALGLQLKVDHVKVMLQLHQ